MILAIGEILCDLIGNIKDNNVKFDARIGGAPFNVASNLANLGVETAFYGVLGNDILGKFLINEVKKIPNLINLIEFNDLKNTTQAIFIKEKNGDGKFEFIRKNGADYSFNENFLDKLNLDDISICHFGSLFLSNEKAKETINKYILKLKKHNVLLSFDVNFRDDIFEKNVDFKGFYNEFIKKMDIVKFTVDEIKLLSNKETLEEAINYFSFLKLIFITLGSKGSLCIYKKEKYFVEGLKNIIVKDSIGAGDSFFSGVLYSLNNLDIDNLTKEDILNALNVGNRCGAKTVAHIGATNAYYSLKEVMEDK